MSEQLFRAKHHPQVKRPRGRPHSIRAYELVKTLLNEGPKAASEKYGISYEILRLRWNKFQQKLDRRSKRGEGRWWIGKCEVKDCFSFWIVPVDKKDEVKTSLCCPSHFRRKRRIFRLTGAYGRKKDLWRMAIYLKNGLLWSMIQHLMPREHWKVVCGFFINGIADPGELSRKYDLKNQEEAEKIIIHASILLRQALKCLTTKVNEASWKPITYWSMRHGDLSNDIRIRQFSSMRSTCRKSEYGRRWVTPLEMVQSQKEI